MKAVVFDLDGTLLDTLADIANACNAALARNGFGTHPVDAYKYFVGDGVSVLISRAVAGECHDPQVLQEIAADYREEYDRQWAVTTRVYRGIPALLDSLSRRGIILAVLSNKPDDFTQKCVRRFLPRWSFSLVLGASHAFPGKPNPAGALHIATELKVPPRDFVYRGDTATDMKTANSAGMLAVGALWGFREAQELEDSGARYLIKHPSGLLKYL